MPRLAKVGLLGKNLQRTFQDIDDRYLAVVEHATILSMIQRFHGDKSRMNQLFSFVVLCGGYEYLLTQVNQGEKVGGDL